ncbi:ComEA family DNA-binding protein [Pseudothermotoga thermarum]|uniref:Competence protein ComEA helix-hairpin-helix repeat protein n=1 Tax=Pseudothermotoga thermarum DSM 5069 TaxID=688269 RepID=F7YU91_9THEM|nr:ComEA family DNA-binding protein [Pseudothermotoga thermarum]AEH50189.1 competence protein ComEA helix-hairpin-helix repeat protein [Pseudothermotoga thermarum DSM 5069]
MNFSLTEKRIIFLSLVGLFILLGLAFEKAERKAQPTLETQSRSFVEFPIDINKASYEELLVLPGIGPTKARAIVEYRQKYGPFESLPDLAKVSGIGKKTVERLANFVKIEGTVFVKMEEKRRINVNIATLEQLCELPGIGEVKASQIIKYRQENGPFKKPEDLLKVPGIGPKTLEKIKDFITF